MTGLAQLSSGASAVSLPTPAVEVDVDLDFDIMRAAVNIARFEQVQTLKHLKERLASKFPEATEARIDGALKIWAQRIVRTEGHLN